MHWASAMAIGRRAIEAHYMLGTALKHGDRDGAMASLNEAIRLNPNAPGPYSTSGQSLRMRGDLEGSRRVLAEAARIQHEAEAKLADMLRRK